MRNYYCFIFVVFITLFHLQCKKQNDVPSNSVTNSLGGTSLKMKKPLWFEELARKNKLRENPKILAHCTNQNSLNQLTSHMTVLLYPKTKFVVLNGTIVSKEGGRTRLVRRFGVINTPSSDKCSDSSCVKLTLKDQLQSNVALIINNAGAHNIIVEQLGGRKNANRYLPIGGGNGGSGNQCLFSNKLLKEISTI